MSVNFTALFVLKNAGSSQAIQVFATVEDILTLRIQHRDARTIATTVMTHVG